MRVAIVGSRLRQGSEQYRLAGEQILALVQSLPPDAVIVSGGAVGVDTLAAGAARAHGLTLAEHLPDWERFGRSAGYRRNVTIVDDADVVHAWWDGESPGTKLTIDIATKAGKPVEVHPV